MRLLQADPVVSEVDLLDESEPFHVAQSSVSSDSDGVRQGTLLVPSATDATMQLADGSTEPIDLMNIRITEFTVGDGGQQAMPAALPPTSQYTYAFEVNADEAVAAGAKEIHFSQPLIYYVNNFLNFPSGTRRTSWLPTTLIEAFGSLNETGSSFASSPRRAVLPMSTSTADAAAETPAELAAVWHRERRASASRQLVRARYEPVAGADSRTSPSPGIRIGEFSPRPTPRRLRRSHQSRRSMIRSNAKMPRPSSARIKLCARSCRSRVRAIRSTTPACGHQAG